MSIEEQIHKVRFPNEEFNANDFRDWAGENSDEAYKLCLQVAQQQIEELKAEIVMLEKCTDRAQTHAEELLQSQPLSSDAIEFAEWILEKSATKYSDDLWQIRTWLNMTGTNANTEILTTENLYEKFTSERNNTK